MGPEQQSALQELIGRDLTDDETAAIAPLMSPENRNDAAITAALSQGRVRIVSREIGIGTILMALAPNGGAFLDGLVALGAQDRNVYWSLELIKQGRFDVGLVGTRLQMQALGSAMPDLAPAFGALLALAETPDPLPLDAVSRALNLAEGRMVL